MGVKRLNLSPDLLAQMATVDFNPTEQIESWNWLTWGIIIPSILGIAFLLKPVRQLFARFTALDPDNPVHTVALSMTMLVLINLAFTLGVGLGNLSAQLAQQADESGTAPISLAALWVQAGMFVLMALIGVGWLSRLSGAEALARLGIVRPTLRQIAIGVAIAFVLVPVVMVIEAISSWLGLGVSQDIESLTEQLLGPIFSSPIGVLSIGIAAAIGEEPIFRGAAQPRFGLVLTAVLFALLHSNYGISVATLVVFLLGLVLGFIRIRYNTTTAMVTHAVYNSTLAGLAFLAARMILEQ